MVSVHRTFSDISRRRRPAATDLPHPITGVAVTFSVAPQWVVVAPVVQGHGNRWTAAGGFAGSFAGIAGDAGTDLARAVTGSSAGQQAAADVGDSQASPPLAGRGGKDNVQGPGKRGPLGDAVVQSGGLVKQFAGGTMHGQVCADLLSDAIGCL